MAITHILDPNLASTTASPSDGAPSLGYGNRDSADIDQVNQWMRSQPWYQQLFQSWGVTPESHAALSDGQKQQIIKAAQAHGVVVDEGGNGQTVDDTGNFQAKSHLGRNIAIAAGIAAAAIAAPYAIPAIAGAVGGGGATAAGLGAADAAGAGTAASLAGIEGGAYGLDAGALASLGGGAGAAGAGAGGGAAASLAEPGGWDAAGNWIGDTTVNGEVGAGSGLVKSILGTAGAVGSALGAAGSGAANARTTEALINQRQDALAQSGYLDALQGANTDLNQKKFALAAPAQRESNAVKGDILSNAKDFSYGAPTMVGNIPVPSSSGGLRPSIFSDSTKALGALVPKQQLAGQQAGDQFAPLPPVPSLTQLPSPGVGSGILNTAGTVGNLANLLKNVPGAVSWLG